jgi:hypothetical protein
LLNFNLYTHFSINLFLFLHVNVHVIKFSYFILYVDLFFSKSDEKIYALEVPPGKKGVIKSL